jgi:peptide/nickel transport system substrate-binding protein
LRIRTKEPDPLLARRLNMLAMVAPKAWKTMGAEAFARAPVGTGPYRLAQWVEDNKRVRLQESPTSWRKVADAKTIEVVVLSDPSARIKALLSGQLDIVAGLGPDDLDAVRAAGFQAVVIGGNSVMCIAFRTVRADDAPLKDVRVRQALNYAVDKQGIVDAILLGTTRVASQGVAFGMPGHNPEIAPVPYDPAKAKALLAEAGYADGFPLTIAVYGGLLPNDTLIFQKVAQDLGAVGVKVELRPLVFADYVRRLFAGDWQGIDAFSNGWLGSGLGDPIRSIDQFSCRFTAPFFCDESVLPAIDATRTEMDPARREALMHKVMAELNRVGVALWLVEFSAIYGVAPRIGNFDTRDVGVKFEQLTLRL